MKFKYLTALITMLLSMLVFTACPDKPYEGDDPTPNPPQPTKTVQLSSIEITGSDSHHVDCKFIYDERERIICLKTSYSSENYFDYELTEFTYNPFCIITDKDNISASLSSKGYITYAKPEDHNSICTYEYDSNGHLIRRTYTDYYEDSDCQETVYTWDNDRLIKVVQTDTYEGKFYWRKTWRVSYGKEENSAGIWPVSFNEIIDFEVGYHDYQYVLQAGFLGVAPSHLPILISCEKVFYDSKTWKYNDVITTELDSKGRLIAESIESIDLTSKNNMLYKTSVKYDYR